MTEEEQILHLVQAGYTDEWIASWQAVSVESVRTIREAARLPEGSITISNGSLVSFGDGGPGTIVPVETAEEVI